MKSTEYTYLLQTLSEREIKHKAVYQKVGISKTMFSRKLHSFQNAKFSVDEAIKIQQAFFSDIPIEILFKRKE